MKYKLQHFKDAVAEPMPEYLRDRVTDGMCSINGITCTFVHMAYRNGGYIRVPVPFFAILDPANDNVEQEYNKLCAAAY